MSGQPNRMKLTDDVVKQFHVVKVLQQTDAHTRCIDFSKDGNSLLVCDPTAVTIYSCAELSHIMSVPMQQHQPQVACYAHQNDRMLHNSPKLDSVIRCMDLENYKNLRFFNAHSKDVCQLICAPSSQEQFISLGLDNLMFVWDIRSSSHTQRMVGLCHSHVAFDPEGLVMALSSGTERIDLHDMRMLGVGPFSTFKYERNPQAKWTQLQFAPDGKTLLISTNHAWCFTVDAFYGHFCQRFTGHSNERRLPLDACFSPDSKYVFCGADKGCVQVWQAGSGTAVCSLNGNSADAVQHLRFNPKYALLAESDLLTLFWAPTI